MLKSITQVNQNDKQISKTVKRFFIMQEISRSDISGITTKAPCEVALMGERHVRIEISDFVMRTFVQFAHNLKQSHQVPCLHKDCHRFIACRLDCAALFRIRILRCA